MKGFTSDQELTSVQAISEQGLRRDYFQSQLSQVSTEVNFWASLHSSVHSGSGKLFKCVPNLPEEGCRIQEVHCEIKT